MEISWKSERLQKELEDYDFLKRQYGDKVAHYVVKRLNELKYALSYVDIPPNAKKHSIKDGKQTRYFAVDLPEKGKGRGKWRLAFVPVGDYDPANQRTILAVKIIGIENYH